MDEKQKSFSTAGKVSILLVMLFIVTCFSVCAENKSLSSDGRRSAYISDRSKVVELAKSLEGKPYRYGAYGPSSFDCSGFVYYVARTAVGKQLPRTATAIYDFCTPIESRQLEPGDLVFFKTTSSGKISHVGIYIGNNEFISALSDSTTPGVVVRSLSSSYWKKAYCGAGKFLPNENNSDSGSETTEKRALGINKTSSTTTVAYEIDGCTCNECSPCSFLW